MAKYHNDKKMSHVMMGIDSYMNSANSNTQHKSKTQNKSKSVSKGQFSQPNPANDKSNSTKGRKYTSTSNDNYPWTALIGVNEVAKLNAIQQLFGCKSRTDALQLVFKHCKGLITKSQKIDYKVLCKIFTRKNRPKAKARYQKYFNKNK